MELAREFAQNAFVWCESTKAPELVIVDKWRLVLDTQVWLDWLTFDDPSVVPLKDAQAQGRLEIYIDAAAEAELARVLAYPLRKTVADASLQKTRLAEARRLSRRRSRELADADRASLPRCSDPDDQKFLELAAAVQAHALVTKDRALLELARRAPFRIVPPAAAARLLDGPDQG
jgi:putative PIN family toxin of toxin-antitoxin system